jgi:transcriptional antiterminator
MLNKTDETILERLLNAKEPISGKELSKLCGAAVNTVRKEIDLINEEISAHGLLIRSKLAVGFYIEITDPELAGAYTDNWLAHLRRTRDAGLIYSPRAYYLTRRLLSADRGLSIEGLCQELYYSKSALNKELKQVRDPRASKLAAGGPIQGAVLHAVWRRL